MGWVGFEGSEIKKKGKERGEVDNLDQNINGILQRRKNEERTRRTKEWKEKRKS